MPWSNTTPPVFSSDASKERKTMVSLAHKTDDEFTYLLEQEIKKTADKMGYSIMILDSKNSTDLQLAQVASARQRGEEVIIINLVDPATSSTILEAAGDMTVMFINRPPSDLNMLGDKVIFIGVEERDAGRMQGEWLAKHFKEQGQTHINYLLLHGPLHLPSSHERTEAVLEALKANGMTISAAAPPIVANYDRNEAMIKTLEVLRKGVEFDAIISNNDAMALGAIQAMEYAKMDPKETVIVGIDAIEPAMHAFIAGKLDMTVFQDINAKAVATISVLSNILSGHPPTQGLEQYLSPGNPYVVLIPFEPVTRHHIPKNLHF